MAIPGDAKIEIPLLTEILKAGGKAKPQQLYDAVAAHFPEMTQADLARTLKDGHSLWRNRVQWARQRLKDKGDLDGSVKGVWAISEAGQQRLAAGQREPEVSRRRRRPRREAHDNVNHDELARALQKIGEAFGFHTEWKPKVNLLRPPGFPIKAKKKTLDVAWQIAGLAWVPIEVQVGGSVADLIYRFNQVQQWSIRLVVVTVPKYREELEEVVDGYSFPDKVVILDAEEVIAATRGLNELLDLRKKVFESS